LLISRTLTRSAIAVLLREVRSDNPKITPGSAGSYDPHRRVGNRAKVGSRGTRSPGRAVRAC